MEKESPRYRLVEANSTGGQGSRRAVEPGGGGGFWRRGGGDAYSGWGPFWNFEPRVTQSHVEYMRLQAATMV